MNVAHKPIKRIISPIATVADPSGRMYGWNLSEMPCESLTDAEENNWNSAALKMRNSSERLYNVHGQQVHLPTPDAAIAKLVRI